MNVRELLDKRAKLIADARGMIDNAEKENRDLTAEEEHRYDEMLSDAEKIKGKIDREQRLSAVESAIEADPVAPEDREPVSRMGEDEHLEERSQIFQILNANEYRSAFSQYLRLGNLDLMEPDARAVIRKAHAQARALQVDLGPSGGYLFGMQTDNKIIKGLDNLLFIRQYATPFQLEGASTGLGCPTLESDPDDADWTAEIGEAQEDSDMDFGKRELKPSMLSKLLKVSIKMLQKMPSVENLIAERMAYKFAVPQENGFLNGSGANQPLGVFTASNDGVPTTRDVNSGHATQITADALIDMKYKLKSQYWREARWTFHRDAMKMISKLKDGEGQYLLRTSLRDGEPDMILGRPVDLSEYAPNTFTENSYIGMLSAWRYYYIADDLLYWVQVLKEKYATTNQVGFIGRGSSDGMPVLGEAFARMKLSAG